MSGCGKEKHGWGLAQTRETTSWLALTVTPSAQLPHLTLYSLSHLGLSHIIMAEEQEQEHEQAQAQAQAQAGGRGSISMYDPARDRWEEHPLPPASPPGGLADQPGLPSVAVSSSVEIEVVWKSPVRGKLSGRSGVE
ncbi:hypothetical protein BO70DRAFT_61475 [Aspergillus heteromorphus CBS 117.55]|uniref:Uncharacterized protein n=1 Tax=Aspergillus heteromorphus CBS 117.55 TaxID=1448321 RepID=A0A317W293_9EURO|nr:uncharacterized protein BO70DRAFT_61475 [Aspergillus heteromorphus CBS 117.55]PWY78300.1 hypothetical protein BO70DRAFT_61475 [Aspergillus heteromorphus CBS 117.55]